jgi:transcriptional regulator with XRE-family HTH domain
MHNRAKRTPEANAMNKIIGNNLRYIRNRRKLTLQRLGTIVGLRYQQIGKYELAVDQMSAYRIYQFSHVLKVKIKYFYDKTYIDRMNGYHTGKAFFAAMPPELLDIDQLQSDAVEAMDTAELQANL